MVPRVALGLLVVAAADAVKHHVQRHSHLLPRALRPAVSQAWEVKDHVAPRRLVDAAAPGVHVVGGPQPVVHPVRRREELRRPVLRRPAVHARLDPHVLQRVPVLVPRLVHHMGRVIVLGAHHNIGQLRLLFVMTPDRCRDVGRVELRGHERHQARDVLVCWGDELVASTLQVHLAVVHMVRPVEVMVLLFPFDRVRMELVECLPVVQELADVVLRALHDEIRQDARKVREAAALEGRVQLLDGQRPEALF
eukprot:CAMPEP_0175283182 /NCGR_PEP_ID=MMETSP0093-20121207/52016_1 /TAXON_ID=311494 /ORGANISM="Alexandrium monilatum, Strain CCMP3105" /LENGTH=250 /DNA_ID=CAMNT_0016578409 /DNA_START=208 /DNA_END=957 /DNA_ORIENTATION=+